MPNAPIDLRCEDFVNPLGLTEPSPRLSWRLDDTRAGAKQTAYEIATDNWSSGKVQGDQTSQLPWPGAALRSRDRTQWRVRVWDQDDQPSTWSEHASFELGLLERSEWSARWIQSAIVGGGRSSPPVPVLRKKFDAKSVGSARLYITALGLHHCCINGKVVTQDVLRPGWTDYATRVQVQTYDVTALIKDGANVMTVELGDGWYCGHMAWRHRQYYGDRPKLLLQLELTHSDGSVTSVLSDESWTWRTGATLQADLLMGEHVDARIPDDAWHTPSFDASDWQPVETPDVPPMQLIGSASPPVRAQEVMHPVADPVPGPGGHNGGSWIFDFGQNLAGVARVTLDAPAGKMIRLRHAEILQSPDRLYTENLRSATATDFYTTRQGRQTFEPKFTFHGFRYLEIAFWPGEKPPTRDDVQAIVLNNDMRRTGTFECSDELVNQLQSNIFWGQKGNFLEVPTDCPQRDERLGWTGDAQVFIRTAAFNMDVNGFFEKWLMDLADSQGPNGAIPSFAPDMSGWSVNEDLKGDGGPAWSDAMVICPWTIWKRFGNTRVLQAAYPHMVAYLKYLLEVETTDGVRRHAQHNKWGGYGDWLAVGSIDRHTTGTPKDLIGTAYLAYDLQLMAEMADALGKTDDANTYRAQRQTIAKAFADSFLTPAGRINGSSQTCYLLALAFDLVPEEVQQKTLSWLVQEIKDRDWHLSTGFVGTPLLCPVLSRFGRHDVAYKLLMQTTYPGWLFPVTNGATTMWERWNSWTPTEGFGDAGMNSFNHYAYGAIGQWMYDTVAGLDALEPGFKRIRIAPVPPPEGQLTHASATLLTPHGEASSAWRVEGETFTLNVTIPPNTTAQLTLPAAGKLIEGETAFAKQTDGQHFELAAGTYAFTAKLTRN